MTQRRTYVNRQIFEHKFRNIFAFSLSIASLTLSTSCKHDEQTVSNHSIQAEAEVTTSPPSFNFVPLKGLNRFAMVSRPPGPSSENKFNVCLHDAAKLRSLEKFMARENLKTAVIEWWNSVDEKLFPAAYIRRPISDLNAEWATLPSTGLGAACKKEIRWDLHVYHVNSFIKSGETLNIDGRYVNAPAATNYPGTSGPAIFFLPSTDPVMVALHEFGHYMGLDDTYEVPVVIRPDGRAQCKPRRNPSGMIITGDREPDSIMCDSKDLTDHDYDAADCMYCASWPGAMMPNDHPCKETLKSDVCKDLALDGL